jgi:hypothetical protein
MWKFKTVSVTQVSAINVNREKRRTVVCGSAALEREQGLGAAVLEQEHVSAGGARLAEELSATSGAVRTARRARALAAAAAAARWARRGTGGGAWGRGPPTRRSAARPRSEAQSRPVARPGEAPPRPGARLSSWAPLRPGAWPSGWAGAMPPPRGLCLLLVPGPDSGGRRGSDGRRGGRRQQDFNGERPAAMEPRSGASRGPRDSHPGAFARAPPASVSSSCPAHDPGGRRGSGERPTGRFQFEFLMSVLTCNVLKCARTSLQKLICTVSASLNSGRREYYKIYITGNFKHYTF